MKAMLLISAFTLSACSTTLYSPITGQRLACFHSNLTDVHYIGGGVDFACTMLDNAIPTTAAWSGADQSFGTIAIGALPFSPVARIGATALTPAISGVANGAAKWRPLPIPAPTPAPQHAP